MNILPWKSVCGCGRRRLLTLLTFYIILALAAITHATDWDHDGLDDFWQERYGVESWTGALDEDGDGLINLIEAISWCDPHDATSALSLVFTSDVSPIDGLEDSWQRRYGIYPQPPAPANLTQAEKLADPDGDGRTNLEESVSGTDPWTWDKPGERVGDEVGVGGGMSLENFTLSLPRTIAGKRYRLAGSADLESWSWVDGGAFFGTGNSWQMTLDVSGYAAYFFRFVMDEGDDDGDGLSNWHELTLGSNPDEADSDGDGQPDGSEIAAGLSPTSFNDRDQDGLSDYDEIVYYKTDPDSNADLDGDGLSDAWEILYGLNFLDANSSGADFDDDGVSDAAELLAHTDPSKADTDDDGLLDGWEVSHGYLPLVPDADLDRDGDGRTAREEVSGDPNYDGDGDLLADWWERLWGFDPANADQNNNGVIDGNDDSEPQPDGRRNVWEYRDGYHPHLPDNPVNEGPIRNLRSNKTADGGLDLDWDLGPDPVPNIVLSVENRVTGTWRVLVTLPPTTTHFHASPELFLENER